jgi:hypothetical protein
VLTSAVLYSSFFTNWRGVIDSYAAYAGYIDRSGGSGHEQPWYFYLRVLAWHRDGGVIWSGAAVLVLAAVGAVAAFLSSPERNESLHFLRFLVFYAAATFVVYSAIPYKTPWSILSFHHATVLLAGFGTWKVLGPLRSLPAKVAGFAVVALAVGHLALQAHRAAFRFPADPRNPFVYSHTTTSFERLVRQVESLERINGSPLRVEVAHDEFGWPLPWYLRGHPSARYQSKFGPKTALGDVVMVDAADPEDVIGKLAATHTADGPYGLRPHAWVVLLVRNELWAKLLASRGVEVPGAP